MNLTREPLLDHEADVASSEGDGPVRCVAGLDIRAAAGEARSLR